MSHLGHRTNIALKIFENCDTQIATLELHYYSIIPYYSFRPVVPAILKGDVRLNFFEIRA